MASASAIPGLGLTDTYIMVDSLKTRVGWRYWALLLGAIGALKGGLWWLDPTMGFFFGDSASYLYTAVSEWIPPDRSYSYGFLVRYATLGNRSLDWLVINQILLSVLVCLLVAVILIRFLRCSPGIAAAAALLCTIEPVQLLYERYLMAENMSLFAFALFIFCLLSYLRRGQLPWLVVATLLGVLAVSLRTAYLPAVFGCSMLAVLYHATYGASGRGSDGDTDRRMGARISAGVAHLAVFLVLFINVYALERSVVKYPESPYFLVAAWAPLLAADDFPSDPVLEKLTQGLPCALADSNERVAQLWIDGCLISRIKKHFPNPGEALSYARQLSMRILLHDPVGMVRLAEDNWLQEWNEASLRSILDLDRGRYPPTPDDFVDLVKTHFGEDVSNRHLKESLTRDWYGLGYWWYHWLQVAPLVLLLWWLITRRHSSPASLILAAASLSLLVVVTSTVTIESMRFYHGIAWLSVIALGSMLDTGIKHLRGWV